MTKTAGSLILMVGYLGPGGAERQITYLARGMVQAGWDTSLLTFSLRDDGAHFADVLRAEHIPLHALDRADPLFRSQGLLLRLTMAAPMLNNLPVEIESEVVKAAALFLRKRPDLVICYLDRVNIVGGLAAVIAGVPRVLLSGRNLNPSHFPYLDRPWFQQFYRLLLASPGVTLMTNSHAGARSYEHWLGLPHASVPVIHNGLAETALPEAAPEQVASLRAELGLAHGSPLVLGVFRLSP
ncbi:MAG: glycosyltransferase [Magnetospirillum sp.]|nr:glycosyltransferase [Magnetospirillum sp.]